MGQNAELAHFAPRPKLSSFFIVVGSCLSVGQSKTPGGRVIFRGSRKPNLLVSLSRFRKRRWTNLYFFSALALAFSLSVLLALAEPTLAPEDLD